MKNPFKSIFNFQLSILLKKQKLLPVVTHSKEPPQITPESLFLIGGKIDRSNSSKHSKTPSHPVSAYSDRQPAPDHVLDSIDAFHYAMEGAGLLHHQIVHKSLEKMIDEHSVFNRVDPKTGKSVREELLKLLEPITSEQLEKAALSSTQKKPTKDETSDKPQETNPSEPSEEPISTQADLLSSSPSEDESDLFPTFRPTSPDLFQERGTIGG